jgi:transposase
LDVYDPSSHSRVIARFGRLLQPPATVFACESAQQLQDWVRRRQQLVEMLSGEKNRLQQLNGRNKAVLKDEVEAHIEWLKDRIAQLDETIEQLSQQQSQWREDKALLMSVKGIGPVVSTTLLAEMPESDTPGKAGGLMSRTAPRAGVLAESI